MPVTVSARRAKPAWVATFVASASLITVSALSGVPTESDGWRVYVDQAIGISIRVPPSMSVAPGEEPQVGFHWPKPDVQLVLNDPHLDRAGITRALVVVYGSAEGYCPPDFYISDKEQTLDGRGVYHHTWWDAAGAFGFHTDGFSTLYRGKCFLVEMIIETMRSADEAPQSEKRRQAHFDEITGFLVRVMRTTRFLDPSGKK